MDANSIRDQQRATWDQFSKGWRDWDSTFISMLAPIGSEMIAALEPAPGSSHLEVAAGTGEPGLTIARLMGTGRVVLTDLSAKMLDVATDRAAAQGIDWVETVVAGVDDLPFEAESFDTISVRFGYMFFPDIPAAISRLASLLRPGGRLSGSVWVAPQDNPWASVPMTSAAAHVDLPTPPPDAPGLWRCAAPGSVSSLYSAAGLVDVREVDVFGALELPSVEEYWAFINEVTAPVVAALTGASDEIRRAVHDEVITQVAPYVTGGKVSLPLHALCIHGRRA